MSFGKNLQFLRKMHNSMTQEELAERMGVSRQTISKWESETAYPEMEKAFELCQFFSCSMDRLFRENMNMENEAYSPVRIEELEAFRMVRYVVISHDPETGLQFPFGRIPIGNSNLMKPHFPASS